MTSAKSQPSRSKRQRKSHVDAPSSASAPSKAVLDYVSERAVANVAPGEPDAVAALLSSLSERMRALETRNQELEATVRSLRNLSDQLQDALHEAQLGFRRHIRQRIPVSELQAALAFSTPSASALAKADDASTQEASSNSDSSDVGSELGHDSDGTPETPSSEEVSSSPSSPPDGGASKKSKRDAHGRSKVQVIPQVVVEIVPVEVQLDGLKHFDRVGVEDSPVLGYRRGGPVQIIFRRVKFVGRSDSEASDGRSTSTSSEQSQVSPDASATAEAASTQTELTGADDVVSDSDVDQAPQVEPGCSDPAPAPSGSDLVVAKRPVTVSASEVLCVPPDPGFKRSPFVDGALVWYMPKPPPPQPDRQVLIGDLPERPLVRGMADASLIAHAICHKLDFYMPYYRQQTELSRYGLPLSRANLCRWHFEAGALVMPVAEAMWHQALERSWFAMDATGTAIFAKEKYRKGHIYVLVAPGDSVLFRYAPKYDGATVEKLFGGTQAIVVADASSCNNPAFGPGRVNGSGCWSHARKRWVAAFKAGDTQLAAPGLQFIRELFRIEDEISLLSADDRLRIRTEKSAPIIAAFYDYVGNLPAFHPDAPMYEAVGYAVNQKDLLCRFLTNGQLPIHNNWAERALRKLVKGRVNWLFMYSDQHAEHTCALASLIVSCDQHGLDPEFYLQEVLTVAPTWPRSRAIELSPKFWLDTRQRLIRDGALRYIDLAPITGSRLVFRPN